MKKENGYFVWNKGVKREYLSDFFTTKELECKCTRDTCKEQRISEELITKLTTIREEINSPLFITSAFRCPEHQEHLRSAGVNTVVAKKSQHELGNAVDVSSGSLTIDKFLEVCERYFDSIGVARNFLHLDTRKGVKRRWKY